MFKIYKDDKMRIFSVFTILLSLVMCSAAYAADNIQEAFAQGSLKAELRTFYFTRNFDESDTREDFAAGTLFYYKTAPLHGLSAGLSFATSNKITDNDDNTVYGLLAKSDSGQHKNYAKFQEYYIQGDWFDTKIKYGAQELYTPFANTHDIRMTPKTYRGLSVVNNSLKGLTLSGYYLNGYRGWADEEFTDMTSSAGATEGSDSGLFIGGLGYDLPFGYAKTNVQLWQYHLDDVANMTYAKISVAKKIGDFQLSFNPMYLRQNSAGNEYAGDIDSVQYGFNTGVTAYGVNLTLYHARTRNGNVFAPWGDEKVIVQQILASDRKDENAYGCKLGYNFKALGLEGLDAYVYRSFYDTPDSGSNATSDITETDFSVQYSFSETSSLKGLSLRARYAIVDEDTAEDFNDFRFYLKYQLAFGGIE